MRYSKLLTCIVSLAALGACSDDEGVTDVTLQPAALVRFINAVPDTGTVDLRFIDKVENLPTLLGVAFRAHSGGYQRVAPGARPTRVFPNSNDPKLTQIMLVDTTVTLSEGQHYTLVYVGRAAGNQDRLAVLVDPPTPTPPAGNIAINVLNASVALTGPVDIYVAPATSTTVGNADPIANAVTVVKNVAFLGRSAYVNIPVRPTTGTPLYQFVVTAAGSTTPIFSAIPNLPGIPTPTGQLFGPQPGVQISGSVLTAVIAPGSVVGTRQSTSANQTPTVVLWADKTLDPQ